MQNIAYYVNWQEITYLHAVWDQLHRELENVENLLPQARHKRGLLNFGGHVLNFLFGTATSADLMNLHEVVENIKTRQTTITHSVEHQLTYTKELDESVKQSSQDIATLAKILKIQVSDLSKLNTTIKQLEANISHRLDYMAQISQTIRELEFFSLQLEQEITNFRQGLDVTSTGKLSAALLPPHNLSLLLQQVALKLPTDVALLAGTSLEDMFVYYQVARVHAYATPSEIRLVIRLPLRGTDRVMNLYPYLSSNHC
jgi:exonuclease VII small subunit